MLRACLIFFFLVPTPGARHTSVNFRKCGPERAEYLELEKPRKFWRTSSQHSTRLCIELTCVFNVYIFLMCTESKLKPTICLVMQCLQQ
mmetsp:Transcript_103610/g.190168  ORF Transcript_103610/g.190168 Transcript_103610/m.190168 type:complete len:89 (+) Transcript_103610:662-928(+)